MGTYSDTAGSANVTQCSPGTFNNVIKAIFAAKCVNCPLGTYSGAAAATCLNCNIGTYADAVATATCPSCAAGTANALTKSNTSTACIICAAGKFSLTGSSVCTPCPLGSFQDAASSASCKICPAGTYSDNLGSSSCTPCPVGTASNVANSKSFSACSICPAGTFAAVPSSTVCVSCPTGSFNTAPKSTSCTTCSPASFTNATASTSCIPCLGGEFALGFGSPVCQPVGQVVMLFKDITASSLVLVASTNFRALLPVDYVCEGRCEIYVNGVLKANQTEPTTYKTLNSMLVDIQLGVDVVAVKHYRHEHPDHVSFHASFNREDSHATDWLCADFDVLPVGQDAWATNSFNDSHFTAGNKLTMFNRTSIVTPAITLPTPVVTFSVTNNGATSYLIGDVDSQSLTLETGTTYRFELGSVRMSSHPFQIVINSVVVGIPDQTGVTFTPDTSFIGTTVQYRCQYHPAMSGSINIVLSAAAANAIPPVSADSPFVYCRMVPRNTAITSATLFYNRTVSSDPNIDINPYANPSFVFNEAVTIISDSQTYVFSITNLESFVSYSFWFGFSTASGPQIYTGPQISSLPHISSGRRSNEQYYTKNIRTLPSLPQGPVQNLQRFFSIPDPENIDQHLLKIHWDLPVPFLQHGDIDFFKVTYRREARSFTTYGTIGSPGETVVVPALDLFVIVKPSQDISLGLVLDQLSSASNYTIEVFPAIVGVTGLGPAACIVLRTAVSAPRQPPTPTLVSRNETTGIVKLKWPSLSDEFGPIIKMWVVAEPYETTGFAANQSSKFVEIDTDPNAAYPELPFPHKAVHNGHFEFADHTQPCSKLLFGITWQSRTTNAICGGICPSMCELGTKQIDPTEVLPTNNQSLNNDNYIMMFNDGTEDILDNTTGLITTVNITRTRLVPYLTMKKRFLNTTTNDEMAASFVIGDGKINPNSNLNNSILNISLNYRFRVVVFTTDSLYSMSDVLEVGTVPEKSTANINNSIGTGVGIAIGCFVGAVLLFALWKRNQKKKHDLFESMEASSSKTIQVEKPKSFKLKTTGSDYRNPLTGALAEYTSGDGQGEYHDPVPHPSFSVKAGKPISEVHDSYFEPGRTGGFVDSPSYAVADTVSQKPQYLDTSGELKIYASTVEPAGSLYVVGGANNYLTLQQTSQGRDSEEDIFGAPAEVLQSASNPGYFTGHTMKTDAQYSDEQPMLPQKTTGAYGSVAFETPTYADDMPALPMKQTGMYASTHYDAASSPYSDDVNYTLENEDGAYAPPIPSKSTLFDHVV